MTNPNRCAWCEDTSNITKWVTWWDSFTQFIFAPIPCSCDFITLPKREAPEFYTHNKLCGGMTYTPQVVDSQNAVYGKSKTVNLSWLLTKEYNWGIPKGHKAVEE